MSTNDAPVVTGPTTSSGGLTAGGRSRPAKHTTSYDHLVPLLAEYGDRAHHDIRREELRRELVEGFRPVAQNIARRYSRRGEPIDDLEQVAAIGLIKALDRFEPARGIDFLSYAVPTMMGEVRRYFRDATWTVRTPRSIKERHQQVTAAANALSQELGRAPTVAELAGHLDLDRDLVIEAVTADKSHTPGSLDETLRVGPDGDTAFADLLATTDRLDSSDVGVLLGDLVRTLPSRERTILVLRFVDDRTQSEIAKAVGISQMHVSRLLHQCLERLRQRLRAHGIDTASDA